MRSTQKSGFHMPTKVLCLFAAVLALAQPAVAQNQARSTADADVPAARPEDVEFYLIFIIFNTLHRRRPRRSSAR